MRYPIRESLLSAALLCVLSSMGHAQAPAPTQPPEPTRTVRPVSNFVPVTDRVKAKMLSGPRAFLGRGLVLRNVRNIYIAAWDGENWFVSRIGWSIIVGLLDLGTQVRCWPKISF